MSTNISKEQFELVYNKYKPNKFIEFVFKYFSKSSQRVLLNKTILLILIILFFLNFICIFLTKSNILFIPDNIIFNLFNVFIGILLVLFTVIITGGIMNDSRIKKIREELNLTKLEYIKLIKEFYNIDY